MYVESAGTSIGRGNYSPEIYGGREAGFGAMLVCLFAYLLAAQVALEDLLKPGAELHSPGT